MLSCCLLQDRKNELLKKLRVLNSYNSQSIVKDGKEYVSVDWATTILQVCLSNGYYYSAYLLQDLIPAIDSFIRYGNATELKTSMYACCQGYASLKKPKITEDGSLCLPVLNPLGFILASQYFPFSECFVDGELHEKLARRGNCDYLANLEIDDANLIGVDMEDLPELVELFHDSES